MTEKIVIKIGAAYDTVTIKKDDGTIITIDRAQARKDKQYHILDDVRTILRSCVKTKKNKRTNRRWYKKKVNA